MIFLLILGVKDCGQDYSSAVSRLVLILGDPFEHYVYGVFKTWEGHTFSVMLF